MPVRTYICHLIFWTTLSCFAYPSVAQTAGPVIDFASDTQSPLLLERVIRKLNHNEKATAMIFKDVVSNRPAGLFILGDVVALGYNNGKWKKIDVYLKNCADAHIPVYAALGNHELILNAARGKRNFQSRFPMHSPTGYSEVIDSVAVILLNSNFTKMQAAEITRQDDWYNNKLKEFDNDPSVKFVIVGCHHSPFTNSKVVKPSVPVLQKFVPAFIVSKKCVLFLSGHSHNFEEFKVQGKYFLVIGGGGGPHQPLNTTTPLSTDLAAGYKPMFHYLEVKRSHDSLLVVSRRLNADFSGFGEGLKLSVIR